MIIRWICENWLELFGVASSLLYIYLEIRQQNSMWTIGFISSSVYAVVFFQSGLYAFSSLYVYYIAASVYGMYCWKYVRTSDNGERPVIRLNLRLGVVLALIAFALFAGIGYFLDNFTENHAVPPYLEALATALSIVTTWMLARKILEQWYVWIFVNFFSAGLYFWCQLYPTSVLFVVYGVMSIIGLMKWKKTIS